MKTSQWFVLTVIFAFAAMISFFNIDSYYGDTHNFNGLKGFLGLGILFSLASIYSIYKALKTQ